jgi:hypothetical protein
VDATTGEISVLKIGPEQASLPEVRAHQLRPDEARTFEGCVDEGRPPEVGSREVPPRGPPN